MVLTMCTRRLILAFIAPVAVSFRAAAVEWPAAGGTYTVPADTTNEVSDADFPQVSKLSKVIFSNAGSALRFTTSTYPSNVSFEGAGSVIMANEVDLGKSITLQRSMDDAASGNFVTFDFVGGIKSNETSGAIKFSPSLFSNATVRFHRELPSNQFSSTEWCGRFDFAEDLGTVFKKNISLAMDTGQFGVVRQRGGNVTLGNLDVQLGGKGKGAVVAWLLEGGSLAIRNNNERWFACGQYIHFRQTGGTFYVNFWQRTDTCNDAYSLPADFIYGGSAVATNSYFVYYDDDPDKSREFCGAMTLAVMDDARVKMGYINGTGRDANYAHVIALNGGVLTAGKEEGTRLNSKSVYFAFNGGTLRNEDMGPSVYGISSTQSPSERWVRVYERGGSVENNNPQDGNNLYLDHPPVLEPVGNVVWSIQVSDELAQKVFQTPPAVVIADSTGAGSNAVAVVDYDFDSGKVTNITVVCRGENYSDVVGDVTANLFFKKGDPLLETPLVCSVGPCQGGDFRFAGRRAIRVRENLTNTYHGATIVDTDILREADHPEGTVKYHIHALFIGNGENDKVCFLNSTSIVVRSGCLWLSGAGNISRAFPAATRLELYGGHVANGTYSFANVIVGGETWLVDHQKRSNYRATLDIPADGTLWVDVADATTNTPKLCYGKMTFGSGVKLTIKNPELLKTRAFKGELTLLDLSGVATVTGIQNLVLDAGLVQDLRRYGRLKWNAGTRKLTWRSNDGFCVRLR